jgi:2-dehydro-3-deoxyphosphogluconate aldolase/(4S)-4-hydroxy-2-oxoglutarate aldolase
MMEQIASILERARIVPVIRAADAGKAMAATRQLLQSGLSVAELTATTPDWVTALTRLRLEFPSAVLGMGTIVTGADAQQAIDAGADFLVSPWPCPAVREVATVPFLEGGFTPGEVAAAAGHGVAKLFPAHAVGPAYLRSLLAVLPGAKIMPTGGIKPADAHEWLAAGAVAVGVGSDLASIPGAIRDL